MIISQGSAMSINLCKASLLAGALGDSMGADIEFSGLRLIRRQYPNGVNSLATTYAPPNFFTDDTQMALFTAEGLIMTNKANGLDSQVTFNKIMHSALLRWYCTQRGSPKIKTDTSEGLVLDSSLWFSASPGMTCMSSLREANVLGQPARNNSKGCGTIMRVAPLAFGLPRENLQKYAISSSALTHGHPLGQLAAAAWAEIIADVVADNHPEETAKAISKQYQDISEDGSIISQAIDLALNAPRDAAPETVETLGKGWNAVEALSIALYACISTKSLDGGLQCALIHSGDSDSTAAIAGNLLGVMYPDEIFCHPLIKGLEGRNIIEDIVFKLAH